MAKTNHSLRSEPVYAAQVDPVRDAAEYAFGSLRRVYSYLNDYAKNEHLNSWARLDTTALLAQVYGDLAPAFNKLQAALKQTGA
jgi:hypothetical protein